MSPIIYQIFIYALHGIGAILVGAEILRGRRTNELRAGTLSEWDASPLEIARFVAVIFLSLYVIPILGKFIAGFAYPSVNIAKAPIYAVGFYQPLVLLAILACKVVTPNVNAPKELRPRGWLSPFARDNVWAFFCIAFFCTLVGGLFSEAIPRVFPALKEIWQVNQILVENLHNLENVSGLFFAVPGIVIFTPIVEEILFRAGLYRLLKSKLGGAGAAISSSFIFAFLHDSPAAILPLACLACALCFAYERSGRIAVPIIIHALFNANTLVAIFLGAE